MTGFFDVVNNVVSLVSAAKPLINLAAPYLANREVTDDTADAAQRFSDAQMQSANLLKGGLDSQLSELEGGILRVQDLMGTGYNSVRDQLGAASDQYGDDLSGAVDDYANYLSPQVDEYGNRVMDLAEQFGENTYQTEAEANQLLERGVDEYGNTLQPYTDAGNEALALLRQQAALDPSKMTPSQQRAMEQFTRQAVANQAASGLRGAGRAGLAALNEGQGGLRAQFYDQNQARAQAAISALNQQGYGATSKVAEAEKNLGTQQADLRFKTGTNAANKLFDTGANVADTVYKAAGDVANKGFTASGAAAQNRFNTGTNMANASSQYYANLADLASQHSSLRGNTAYEKSLADASAVTAAAPVNLRTDYDAAKSWGQTIGNLSSVLNQEKKASTIAQNPW